ncbi:MAG: methyltransferase domain-containing protein, partial [Ardenticatenaceae bacterium]
VARNLASYREKGPNRTTGLLIDALREAGVEGMTLLDIGGGIGAIQHELLKAGAIEASSVEASSAFVAAAQAEAQRQGLADRTHYYQGDFITLANEIPPADIVTLDRVICCYHDMPSLVSASAARARKLYGLVYPRDSWWIKTLIAFQNAFLRLTRNSFRFYIHATHEVDALLREHGLRKRTTHVTPFWQVVLYAR